MGGKSSGLGPTTYELDFLTVAIRNLNASGSMASPLGLLVAAVDRLGHHESASTISGFADTPFTRISLPEINAAITHLCEGVGDRKYQALAEAGKNVTEAAIAAYAFRSTRPAHSQLAAAL
jgi:hypothetical protein